MKVTRSTHDVTLAEYAYALRACEFPAVTGSSAWGRKVAALCRHKMSEISMELSRRLASGHLSATAVCALSLLGGTDEAVSTFLRDIAARWDGSDAPWQLRCVARALSGDSAGCSGLRRKVSRWINGKIAAGAAGSTLFFEIADRYLRLPGTQRLRRQIIGLFGDFLWSVDFGTLSASELLGLHRTATLWYDLRHAHRLEPFTRVYQWTIVDHLTRRDNYSSVAHALLIAEYLEAANYAEIMGLTYAPGERIRRFDPSAYPDDDALARYVGELSASSRHADRETLIQVADHVQRSVADAGRTADYLATVSAIVIADVPSFSYPRLTEALTRCVDRLAKSGCRPLIDLAVPCRALGEATGRQKYLRLFEQILRHCYLTLTAGKSYPALGIDPADPPSRHAAVSLLRANRRTLTILNPRYTLAV